MVYGQRQGSQARFSDAVYRKENSWAYQAIAGLHITEGKSAREPVCHRWGLAAGAVFALGLRRDRAEPDAISYCSMIPSFSVPDDAFILRFPASYESRMRWQALLLLMDV